MAIFSPLRFSGNRRTAASALHLHTAVEIFFWKGNISEDLENLVKKDEADF
jgi:hypothetical protein